MVLGGVRIQEATTAAAAATTAAAAATTTTRQHVKRAFRCKHAHPYSAVI